VVSPLAIAMVAGSTAVSASAGGASVLAHAAVTTLGVAVL
jgi:hypothetical protein